MEFVYLPVSIHTCANVFHTGLEVIVSNHLIYVVVTRVEMEVHVKTLLEITFAYANQIGKEQSISFKIFIFFVDTNFFFWKNSCEIQQITCVPNPCLNNGNCSVINQITTCTCKSGWTGKYCSNDIDECFTPNICYPNSYCINTPGSYSCTCLAGYTGIINLFSIINNSLLKNINR